MCTTELKVNIQKVIQGTNLKVKDVNSLLQRLLSAMIINDDVGEDIMLLLLSGLSGAHSIIQIQHYLQVITSL